MVARTWRFQILRVECLPARLKIADRLSGCVGSTSLKKAPSSISKQGYLNVAGLVRLHQHHSSPLPSYDDLVLVFLVHCA